MKQFLLSLIVIIGITIPNPTEAQESWADLFQTAQAARQPIINLDALINLEEVGALAIQDNAALTNVDGLSSLTSIAGYLNMNYNAALTNLDGLLNLIEVGTIQITFNPALINLDGLLDIPRKT